MRKDIVLPGLAVAGGAAGLALRLWQWRTAYDPETQLFLHGALSTRLLLGVTAAVALLLILLSQGGKSPEDFLPAFACPSPAYMTVMAAAAFLFLGSGVLGLIQGMERLEQWRLMPEGEPLTYPGAAILSAVLCLLAGLSVLLLGQGSYRGKLTARCSSLAPLPACAGLAWVFSDHLSHGTDPLLMRYGFSLAAAALLTLAHYYAAGYCFGRKRLRRMVVCAMLGTMLGIISLADGLSRLTALRTLAFALSATAQAAVLLHNTFAPAPEAQTPERPSDLS
jgi:hypothetical protein